MIKIGVISDIHSHRLTNGASRGGHYYPNMPEKPVSQNPFASLKELIRQKGIKLDYILSPGDLAHQIDPEGLKGSWDQLKLLISEVEATKLVATIGNHDVASRNGGDVFKFIKDFDNDFPVYPSKKSEQYKTQLLQQGFYVINDKKRDILIVVINSCFDHWDSVEASKGKIETNSLAKIKAEIEKSRRRIRMALIHHHPIVHETGIYDTSDLIEGSESLMNCLKDVDFIIHGHKHDFRFSQKAIFPRNLNILSSGSFSCYKTYLQSGALNYFHEIQFHTDKIENCTTHGLIETYAYDPTSGWTRYPHLDEGFGCTLNLENLISYLTDILSRETNISYIEWKELIKKYPLLKYISKSSRDFALSKLSKEGVIKRYNDNNNGIGDIILR